MRARSLIWLLLLCAASARAASPADEARAREHFSRGVELLDARDYTNALREFRAAGALVDNPKIDLNIGTCARATGDHALAANAYARYLEHPQRDPSRVAEVEQLLADLDQRVGQLVVVMGSDASLTIDGAAVPVRDRKAVQRVAPGSHTLVAARAGHAPDSVDVSVSAGEQRRVELGAEKPSTAPGPKLPTTAPATPSEADSGTRKAPERESRADRFGGMLRVDADGRARGAAVLIGPTLAIGELIEVGAGGFIGRSFGAWAGARAYLVPSVISPTLLAGAPVFFEDGTRVGAHGAVGAAWEPSAHVSITLDLGVAHFFSVPSGYEATVFVPSLGVVSRP